MAFDKNENANFTTTPHAVGGWLELGCKHRNIGKMRGVEENQGAKAQKHHVARRDARSALVSLRLTRPRGTSMPRRIQTLRAFPRAGHGDRSQKYEM